MSTFPILIYLIFLPFLFSTFYYLALFWGGKSYSGKVHLTKRAQCLDGTHCMSAIYTQVLHPPTSPTHHPTPSTPYYAWKISLASGMRQEGQGYSVCAACRVVDYKIDILDCPVLRQG